MSDPTLSAEDDEDEISLLDLAFTLRAHLKLLILGPLLAGLCALGITFLIPPTFTATTRVLVPQQQQGAAAMLASQLGQLGALGGAAGAMAGIRNPADTYVAMLKSRTVADIMLSRFKLKDLYEEDFLEDARKELGKRTRTSAGKDGLITIEVDDNDPARAADMANAYVEQLGAMMLKLATTEAGQRRLFFEKRLQEARDELTRAEVALRAGGVGQAALKATPQSALEPLAKLRAQATAQEVRVASMGGAMTESNPELQQARRELSALRAQLERAEQEDAGTTTGSGAEYIARYRAFKYQETLFELMAKQYEMARLDEAREGATIQVVDRAIPPERKSKPKKGLIAVITTAAAAIALLIFIFVRQTWRRAISAPGARARQAQILGTAGDRP
ncbi:MAG: Wzz/FepE/Etk N-terminal domain-containing protein [Betaproteobacteria bacterium]